jgi:hypothetical protein
MALSPDMTPSGDAQLLHDLLLIVAIAIGSFAGRKSAAPEQATYWRSIQGVHCNCWFTSDATLI